MWPSLLCCLLTAAVQDVKQVLDAAAADEHRVADAVGILLPVVSGDLPPAFSNRRRQRIVLPGIGDAEWTTSAPNTRPEFEFLPIEAAELFFEPSRNESGNETTQSPWRRHVNDRTWGARGPELVFKQIGASLEAEGVLHLMPWNLRTTTGGNIVELASTGCAITREFDLPLTVPPSGIDLRFHADLSNPIELDEQIVVLSDRYGVLPPIPIRVEEPLPMLSISAREVNFWGGERGEQVIQVSVAQGHTLEITGSKPQSCVDIGIVPTSMTSAVVSVKETELAMRRHECHKVVLRIRIDSVIDCSRVVEIRHASGVFFENGVRTLYACPESGEAGEVVQWPSGSTTIFYPERLPCMRDVLASVGCVMVAFRKSGELGDAETSIRNQGSRTGVELLVRQAAKHKGGQWARFCW